MAEQDEMAQRKHYREVTGKKNPRPNHSVSTGHVVIDAGDMAVLTLFNVSFGSDLDPVPSPDPKANLRVN